jgi:hypothetical protein
MRSGAGIGTGLADRLGSPRVSVGEFGRAERAVVVLELADRG